jgi:hypothetical protein
VSERVPQIINIEIAIETTFQRDCGLRQT